MQDGIHFVKSSYTQVFAEHYNTQCDIQYDNLIFIIHHLSLKCRQFEHKLSLPLNIALPSLRVLH